MLLEDEYKLCYILRLTIFMTPAGFSLQGADVMSGKHEYKYTALHFAALSGQTEVCFMLLEAGANPRELNSVGRTASQMAAFVSNHSSAATINNYVPKGELQEYVKTDAGTTETRLPPSILDPFHRFVGQINMHPVRIALNLQKCPAFQEHLASIKRVLELMSEREMARPIELINEVLAFKYHYMAFVVDEVMKCQDHIKSRKEQGADFKSDYVELFAKKLLKEDKNGSLDLMDQFIKKCVRAFRFWECTLLRQLVAQLTSKDFEGTALELINTTVNGQRGFKDTIIVCSACGHEKPEKKCSKCKEVQYCDRECQRLHWFMHKKTCARPTTDAAAAVAGNQKPSEIDTAEIQETLKNLLGK